MALLLLQSGLEKMNEELKENGMARAFLSPWHGPFFDFRHLPKIREAAIGVCWGHYTHQMRPFAFRIIATSLLFDLRQSSAERPSLPV